MEIQFHEYNNNKDGKEEIKQKKNIQGRGNAYGGFRNMGVMEGSIDGYGWINYYLWMAKI